MVDKWRELTAEALQRGDWKAALIRLKTLKGNLASNSQYLKLLCCSYLQAEDWAKVIRTAKKAAGLHPSEPLFYECWSWAEHILGRTVQAAEILESVYPRFRNRENLSYTLSCYYAVLDRLEEAEEFLVHAMRLSSDPEGFVLKASKQRELQSLWSGREVCFAA